MSSDENQDAKLSQEITIDLIKRDKAGNIIEHLRINPDGKEEKLI